MKFSRMPRRRMNNNPMKTKRRRGERKRKNVKSRSYR
jgi:hypothetical protein